MKRHIISLVFATQLSVGVAHAGVNEGDADFYAISDLTYEASAHPTLIGGKPANPIHWTANFYSVSADGSCTSTLIGPNVLFTAAHCVGNGKNVTVTKASVTYEGTCTHATQYATNTTADYALCLMNKPVPAEKYERVNTDPSLLKIGNNLLLTGFGCTKTGGGGGNDGVYRMGEAPIQVLPAMANNDIVTVGKVALCYGDSGGPAYILFDGREEGARIQVSINSRGNIYNTSYLSSVSTTMAINFITSWSNNNNAKICGIHVEAISCHK